MKLREGWTPPTTKLNIVMGRGGLGDAIARLPALRYMEEHYTHVEACCYVQDGWLDLVRYLLPASNRRHYKRLSECPYYLSSPKAEFDEERLTTLNLHLTDHAFLMMMEMLPPSREARAYPRARSVEFFGDQLGESENERLAKAVVFTTDYTAPSRQWPAVHINTLALKVRGAGLTPVLIGTTEPIPSGVEHDPIRPRTDGGIKSDLFIDLRNKTTLIEALGVMQRARAVVGVDNGLLHLAHCTDVPVVVAYTTLDPTHRLPVRQMTKANGEPVLPGCHDSGRAAALTRVIEPLVPCKGCQSRGWNIQKDVLGRPIDWRKCLFDDYACTLTLTADRFYKALQELKVV